MIQLNPQEQFLIHRTLTDPNDTNTYYVQATVRDADDTIIESVNLTDRGNQRFSKQWRVVADRSLNGTGRYISITTRVYTDSGYTTLDTLNGQDSQTYIIQRRIDGNSVSLGGSGGVIDYREIGKIVAEEMKKMPPYPKQMAMKQMDYAPMFKEMAKVIIDRIDKIAIPIPEKVDFFSLEKGLESLAKMINDRPKFEKTDNSQLVNELKGLQGLVSEIHNEYKLIQQSKDEIKKILAEGGKMLSEKLDDVKKNGYMISLSDKNEKDSYLKKLRAKYSL